ncbi:MAG TPA: DUF5916 domain-containing protein [Bacteroidales bacterium]|nr:DUF5916 domain-containing protein [Bacteroidales bacterium]HPS49192.1 DUF5916 domain-containing protein [Bacteroidales bacterium]
MSDKIITLSFLLTGIFLFCLGNEVLAGTPQNHAFDSAFRSKKIIPAVRIDTPPKIDGLLNEHFWRTLPAAKDFVQYSPSNGAFPSYPTEVRFAYDDVALYIGAMMFDARPDSICKELGRRDQVESLNNDIISFDILPYDDDLNMYEFKLSPANVQNDCKYSAIGNDITWDAVWESATSVNNEGWIAEVRIPYSALRFPRTPKQIWGINMWRNLQRRGEYSTWTFVDINDQNIFRYYGDLAGIDSIQPPVRLSFSPYLSGYLEKNPDAKNWQYFIRGGLDLRYGINESYTLDMMLIPDFGQVQSDDQVLNLTPFEIRYDEKRQFFTEATELFDKCEIFYSRRVGSVPKNFNAPYDSLNINEIVSKNPEETRIINATKISGRDVRGLGIGFFNGMTTNTWGILEDTLTGNQRRIMSQPFTNYNVLVLDQNLKNNSYVTLINTNYYTPADRYTANVTGVETKLCNKKNTMAFFGRGIVSQQFHEGISPVFGHRYSLEISKPSGRFQYSIFRDEIGSTYDPNDMGFLLYNNEAINRLTLNYTISDPVWIIRNSQSYFSTTYKTLVKPYSFTGLEFEVYNQTVYKNMWNSFIDFSVQPLGSNDYYEPRVWGWIYKKPWSYNTEVNIGTDQRKMFRIYSGLGCIHAPDNRNFNYWISLIPRFRFSDQFTVSVSFNYDMNYNDRGWVNTLYDSVAEPTIWFGCRDVSTFNNILNIKYIFNTKTSVTLRARHYWSTAKYFEYYRLGHDGELSRADYPYNADLSYNAFSVDLQFVWYFAPGSELSVVWKNNINTLNELSLLNYWDDLTGTLNSPQTNSFSVKVLYYIDYLNIKKLFIRKKG